ncbi:MAG: hypothetical protein AABY10_04355 [Nanoarchaeota archaeon]
MKCRFFIIVFVFIMFVSNFVSAIGITPGRTTLDFQPSLEKDVDFSVLNNEHKSMQVVFVVQGELNSSILLSENNIAFMPSEESKSFKYKVNLPKSLEPGLHKAEIVALEIPKSSSGGTFVGAAVAVVSELNVYVPYPGKYVDFDLSILDTEQNSTATFIVPVVSRGKIGIGEIRALIDIYTPLNEKVGTVETDFTALEPGERTELTAKWPANVNTGSYLAKATVFYDGESRDLEKQFSVGNNLISMESILVNQFSLGEIAKLQILVENKWNQELKNVYANLLVFNRDGETMADVKSASEDIPSLSRKELIAYWDTVGVKEGEYDGKLLIQYGQKSADKNLLLKVNSDSLDITGVGYAIRGRGGGGFNVTDILIVLVIILLIVNLAWFVFFKRSRAKVK